MSANKNTEADAVSAVQIVMGSQSDWATMKGAADTCEALGIDHECRIGLRPIARRTVL